MTRKDYIDELKSDIADVYDSVIDDLDEDIKENPSELESYLHDLCFDKDSVTGNKSGSYTFNRWQAEENIAHCWDILYEIKDELFNGTLDILAMGPEECDVVIRCYLLSEAIDEFVYSL